jgi:hypothetical protein
MKSLVVFVVGAVGFGALALGIGYALGGDEALLQGGVAFALTFVPAAATLAWVLVSYRTTPEMQLMACLGGSGIRMAIALGCGMVLTQRLQDDFGFPFWCWLVLFYLAFLAFEITLVVWQQPKVNGSTQA